MPKNISDAEFQSEVLESDIPVLVDFWAPWCGPCKAIAPILENLGQEFENTLKIVKINVDDHKEIAGQQGVRGIPTLLLVKNGDIVETKVGGLSKGQLVSWLKEHDIEPDTNAGEA